MQDADDGLDEAAVTRRTFAKRATTVGATALFFAWRPATSLAAAPAIQQMFAAIAEAAASVSVGVPIDPEQAAVYAQRFEKNLAGRSSAARGAVAWVADRIENGPAQGPFSTLPTEQRTAFLLQWASETDTSRPNDPDDATRFPSNRELHRTVISTALGLVAVAVVGPDDSRPDVPLLSLRAA